MNVYCAGPRALIVSDLVVSGSMLRDCCADPSWASKHTHRHCLWHPSTTVHDYHSKMQSLDHEISTDPASRTRFNGLFKHNLGCELFGPIFLQTWHNHYFLLLIRQVRWTKTTNSISLNFWERLPPKVWFVGPKYSWMPPPPHLQPQLLIQSTNEAHYLCFHSVLDFIKKNGFFLLVCLSNKSTLEFVLRENVWAYKSQALKLCENKNT